MIKLVSPIEETDTLLRQPLNDQEFASTNATNSNGASESHATLAQYSHGRRSLKLERQFTEYLYRRIGSPAVQIVLWDGTTIGETARSLGRVVIRNPRGLRRLLFGSQLGFGEGYMANDLTIEGDLVRVIVELNLGISRAGLSSRRTTMPRWSGSSIEYSKHNVHRHYDIGNEFYQLWLDPQLVYTCAYYENQEASLCEAQTSKLDYVCRKLRLKPGESVVEAGCGWGALALHMARNYGVTVRAFNLSHEQVVYARNRAASERLDGQIEFIEDDYRNITTKCDVFASVGMLEHVGVENYRGLGAMVGRILNDNGRGLIHSIGRNFAKPLDPWTVKYIFPGAYVPSLREMMDLFEHDGFSVLDIENLRLHYARTCADWLARFECESKAVQQMFDERFVRMWRLYLAASSAAFLSGDLQLFQVVFARANNNELPWTRQDWYG